MFTMDYSISVFKEHQEMVFLVPRVHLGSTSIIRGQLFLPTFSFCAKNQIKDIFKSQFYILPSTLTSVEKNINYFDEIKHIRGTDSYSLTQNSLSGKNVLMSHT